MIGILIEYMVMFVVFILVLFSRYIIQYSRRKYPATGQITGMSKSEMWRYNLRLNAALSEVDERVYRNASKFVYAGFWLMFCIGMGFYMVIRGDLFGAVNPVLPIAALALMVCLCIIYARARVRQLQTNYTAICKLVEQRPDVAAEFFYTAESLPNLRERTRLRGYSLYTLFGGVALGIAMQIVIVAISY